MSKKKKIIIMSSLVFLLAVTAVLNVLLATNVFASGDSQQTFGYVKLLHDVPCRTVYDEKRRAFAA